MNENYIEKRRAYLDTHPWLTFSMDLRGASPYFWMALGEAQSKCEHIAGVPLRPAVAEKLHLLLLAKGVHATTAIEGNTLSEEQVLQQIEGKQEPAVPSFQEYQHQEIQNIVEACNAIAGKLFEGNSEPLSPAMVTEFNRLVLRNLPREEHIAPGQIRKYKVGVAGYAGAPAEDCEYLLQRLCDWLNGDTFKGPENLRVVFGLLKAIVAHVYLAWIHPFGDGNGRTARLIEFQTLISAGVPTPAAHLLSNFYNSTRLEYYRQLDQTSKNSGNLIPFISYAINGFTQGLKEHLSQIRLQQWDVAWRSHIYEIFREKTSKSDRRCRDLLLDLSLKDEPVPTAKLGNLTPRIARYYARLTPTTLRLDIKKLIRMGLAEQTEKGIRPKREIILAFLPRRR